MLDHTPLSLGCGKSRACGLRLYSTREQDELDSVWLSRSQAMNSITWYWVCCLHRRTASATPSSAAAASRSYSTAWSSYFARTSSSTAGSHSYTYWPLPAMHFWFPSWKNELACFAGWPSDTWSRSESWKLFYRFPPACSWRRCLRIGGWYFINLEQRNSETYLFSLS